MGTVIMTKKRRNNGRNKQGRGHVNFVRCETSGARVPKGKAVKKYIIRNMIDSAGMRDLSEACAFDQPYALPKILQGLLQHLRRYPFKVGEEQVSCSPQGPHPATKVPSRRQPEPREAQDRKQGATRSPGHQDFLNLAVPHRTSC